MSVPVAAANPGMLENLESSCVKSNRNMMGWKSEKKSKIGFRMSFFKYLTKM